MSRDKDRLREGLAMIQSGLDLANNTLPKISSSDYEHVLMDKQKMTARLRLLEIEVANMTVQYDR